MSLTITLVHAGANRLRYLMVSTAGTTSGTITTTGAATPDILTDSIQGPIKKLARTVTDGYGKLPAGALTQAQARALWLSDDAANVATITDGSPPTAAPRITFRGTNLTGPLNIAVDANVSVGQATITINSGATGGSGWSAYLDIEVSELIGD